MAHERRNLSQEELEFKKFLKSRLMGMAVIQKMSSYTALKTKVDTSW